MFKRMLKYGLCATLVFLSSWSFAQVTQSLRLEKVFVKWLVDGSPQLKNPELFCWNLEDRILEGEQLPPLNVNSEGPRIALEFEIEKTQPNCTLNQEKGNGWKLRSNSSKRIVLNVDAILPFSRFKMQDSRGRKLELLVEARFLENSESDFLSYFKNSIFSIRGSAIRNKVWQFPFLLAKYELPALWRKRLALQISLGQSLFDGSGKGLRQASFEVGLAMPVLGEIIPYRGRYNLRLRLAYEGIQINDQKSLRIYPLLASQMLGLGSEFFVNLKGPWGAQAHAGYYFLQKQEYNISKIQVEPAVRYMLSERWSLESGFKFVRQNVDNKLSAEKSAFSEYTYFVGVNLRPYLDVK